MKKMTYRSKLQNQLGTTHSKMMKANKRSTRRMAIKLESLMTRNQFKNVVPSHHLDLEMVQLVSTGMFSPKVKRSDTPRTTFQFTVSREPTVCFS